MQELYQVIKGRFDKLMNLLEHKLTAEQYRELQSQQKQRCEKQAWILSMFRARKSSLSLATKSEYYNYSYQIMRVINPEFSLALPDNITQESFLNDFVCLYTKFFDDYDSKFQFKVKIRSLLRPTNHNVVNDLVRYLVDFSRDYSQHLYMWQIKSSRRDSENVASLEKRASLSVSHADSGHYQSCPPPIVLPVTGRDRPLATCRNILGDRECSPRRYAQENDSHQLSAKKTEHKQHYGIMSVQPLPNFAFTDKSRMNIDVVRLRLNQLYREAKYRNNNIKNAMNLYYNTYHGRFNPGILNGSASKQSYNDQTAQCPGCPFKLLLLVQKNGFSTINVVPSETRSFFKEEKNLSPIKDKLRVSSQSIKESTLGLVPQGNAPKPQNSKNEFILNSLKVLRVTENFLPPLHKLNIPQKTRVCSEQQQVQKLDKNRNLSSSNTENVINLQFPKPNPRENQQGFTSAIVYYNQELAKEVERKKMQKRRLSEMKKHFTSEEKKQKTRKTDPEEKIIEWLDKINTMKEIQRKKIMGLV